jgi:hypothetical protein
MVIFNRPNMLTHVEVWFPKYSTQYGEIGERVALPAKYKVDAGTPWIIIPFTKAKHLKGLRYCIKRSDAQKYPIVKNGTGPNAIDCYEIPMSKLEHWDTVEEVKEVIRSFGW